MARFYFDIREDGQVRTDDEGVELPDIDTAEQLAGQAAVLIARDDVTAGTSREVVIEVRNADGNRILIVTLRVVRVAPQSE
jgi:hypothetical protein